MTTPTPNTVASKTPAPGAPGAESSEEVKLRSEAASRRRQLREVEADRDALAADLETARGQLTAWKSEEVTRAIASTVANPETLTAVGFNPAEYVREDFTGDLDGARARAQELRDAHGLAPAAPVDSTAVDVAAELGTMAYAPPAELLRGDTAEELRAHRDALVQWAENITPVGPHVPGENTGSGPLQETDWLKQMFNQSRM